MPRLPSVGRPSMSKLATMERRGDARNSKSNNVGWGFRRRVQKVRCRRRLFPLRCDVRDSIGWRRATLCSMTALGRQRPVSHPGGWPRPDRPAKAPRRPNIILSRLSSHIRQDTHDAPTMTQAVIGNRDALRISIVRTGGSIDCRRHSPKERRWSPSNFGCSVSASCSDLFISSRQRTLRVCSAAIVGQRAPEINRSLRFWARPGGSRVHSATSPKRSPFSLRSFLL